MWIICLVDHSHDMSVLFTMYFEKYKKKKKIRWVSSAAVVIGVLRANFVTISVRVHGSENNYAVWSVRFHLRFPCLVDVGNNMVFTLNIRTPWLSYGTIPKIWTSQYCCLLNLSKTCWMSSKHVDRGHPLHSAASDQGLHCLPRTIFPKFLGLLWYYGSNGFDTIPLSCWTWIYPAFANSVYPDQLILICTVCHSVYEFMSTISIKASDWLTFRNGRGLLIYSEWQGLTRL